MTESISPITISAGLGSSSTNYHAPDISIQVIKTPEAENKNEAFKKVPIDRVIQMLQSYIESNKTSLDISVHEATGDIVVKVISDDDGKVIREIPSEEVLKHAAMMEQMEGLMFDEIV